MPAAVGVPLMVIILLAKVALTPAGKPLEPDTPAFDIPVAPVVIAIVIDGIKSTFTFNVGSDDGETAVLAAVTEMIPVAFTLPQPPVKGML